MNMSMMGVAAARPKPFMVGLGSVMVTVKGDCDEGVVRTADDGVMVNMVHGHVSSGNAMLVMIVMGGVMM